MSTITGNVTGAANVQILTQREAREAQSLSTDDFLKLLLAEIKYQNPLEPMKNNEMLEQMATIQNLQATDALTRQLSSLTEQSQVGDAASLIGKLVRGDTANGIDVAGVVEGLLVENGNVRLVIGSYKVPYENVTAVTEASKAEEG